MRKFICIALLFVFLLPLAACSSETDRTDNPYRDPEGAVRIQDLKKDMLETLHITDFLDLDRDALLNLYGIQPEDVADLACFVTLDGVFPQEAVMIRADDAAAAERISSRLRARLEEFRVQSQNYDAENYAIAQTCDVLSSDVYLALFLTPDYEALADLFRSAMK